jgi:hypothetical protein
MCMHAATDFHGVADCQWERRTTSRAGGGENEACIENRWQNGRQRVRYFLPFVMTDLTWKPGNWRALRPLLRQTGFGGRKCKFRKDRHGRPHCRKGPRRGLWIHSVGDEIPSWNTHFGHIRSHGRSKCNGDTGKILCLSVYSPLPETTQVTTGTM